MEANNKKRKKKKGKSDGVKKSEAAKTSQQTKTGVRCVLFVDMLAPYNGVKLGRKI